MAIVAHDHERPRRESTLRLFVAYGISGSAILLWQTIAQWDATIETLAHLDDAPIVIAIFAGLTFACALLKFRLNSRVLVSTTLIYCAAMIPLLGGVVTAWIAVLVSIAARSLALRGIGPNKYSGSDSRAERARIFGDSMGYGVPVLIATAAYTAVGGTIPIRSTTVTDALHIEVAGIVVSLANEILLAAARHTYGHRPGKILAATAAETGLLALSIPFAITLVFGQVAVGWGMLLNLAFVGLLTFGTARLLGNAVHAARRQLARATSLTTIGNAISLDQPEEQLLATIYSECAKVVDVRNFAIALYDPAARELAFELEMRDGVRQPKRTTSIAPPYSEIIGTQHPLRSSGAKTSVQGTTSVDASWLGVPMVARERVIGVLSIQSNVRNAFSGDDVLLLSAVANQAAAALEHGALVRNLDAKVRERTAQIEAHAEQLAMMNRVTQSITSTHDLDTMLRTTVSELSTIFNAHRTSITLLDEERTGYRVVADSAPEGEPGAVARRTERVMTVPLLVRGEVTGAITIETDEAARELDASDVYVAETIAGQIAGAVEGARLYDEEHRSRELAEAATRAKSQFLANMSHEIRTPLNAIMGFVQVLQHGGERSDADRHALEVISRSGEHLLTLINDVLSMAKIESGRMTADASDFDLPRIVGAVEQMFRLRASAKSIELAVEIAPSVPEVVRGDEAKLRQVLINLLGNGIKFTDRGRVTLRVGWQDGIASFAVEDTGIGIATNDRTRLFEAFTQTGNGNSSREGTGLGLAISRSFVHLMGGEIRVESEPGRGSIFSFAIPVPAADTGAGQWTKPSIVGLTAGETYRILIADDTPENCMILEELFEPLGFEVRSAPDGAAAVEAWRAWQPHLIWMDVRMPDVDGCSATRAIRAAEAQAGRAPVKIIALTASVFERDRETVLAAGCDDFVPKPFLQQTLFDTLARHLGLQWRYAVDTPAPEPALDIARVPRGVRDALDAALLRGDVVEAARVVEGIGAAELRGRLTEMIRSYRFDEVQELLR